MSGGWRIRSITLPTIVLALLLACICAHSEEMLSTTTCEIIANPSAFNHKLVKLTGTVYQGMENFSLSVTSCEAEKIGNWTGIWVEYGGSVRTLEIEGVQTSLLADNQFRSFDSQVKRKGHASATFVGRYFRSASLHRSEQC